MTISGQSFEAAERSGRASSPRRARSMPAAIVDAQDLALQSAFIQFGSPAGEPSCRNNPAQLTMS
jgi:hypothetical protein